MEQTLNGLKAFIVSSSSYFAELADDTTPMKAPAEKDIIIGQVDLTKQKAAVLCSIIPETQTPDNSYIEGSSASNNLTITFICRGSRLDVLTRQMLRYAEAFKNACFADNSCGGICDDVAIESIKYYLDAGIMDNQATACEITIEVNKSV